MGKELFIFTASFPYGIREHWKENEIRALAKQFSKITIVPYAINSNQVFDDENLSSFQIEEPLFTKSVFIKPSILTNLFSVRFPFYFREFFSKRVLGSRKKMISFLDAEYRVEKMLKNPGIRQLVQRKDKENIVLYFYWGVGAAYMVPFLKGFEHIVVRFHRFDLYEYANDGYIPFRRQLLKKIETAILISKNGLEYLQTKYPAFEKKYKLFRIGTHFKGEAVESKDGTLRIVSCSTVNKVKRVSMLLQAVKKLEMQVEWTHIGGGELFNVLEEESRDVPANVKVILIGNVSSKKVMDYFVGKPVDVFVNTSSSEGVPVSIMEALSASVPVIATDVGGTSEIVDENVGKLIPENFTVDQLTEALRAFFSLSHEQKKLLRLNAGEKYRQLCDADSLNEKFAHFMGNI